MSTKTIAVNVVPLSRKLQGEGFLCNPIIRGKGEGFEDEVIHLFILITRNLRQ